MQPAQPVYNLEQSYGPWKPHDWSGVVKQVKQARRIYLITLEFIVVLRPCVYKSAPWIAWQTYERKVRGLDPVWRMSFAFTQTKCACADSRAGKQQVCMSFSLDLNCTSSVDRVARMGACSVFVLPCRIPKCSSGSSREAIVRLGLLRSPSILVFLWKLSSPPPPDRPEDVYESP